MSARTWRLKLEEVQQRHADSIVAAQEWKNVAENRLMMLHGINALLCQHLQTMHTAGEVLGCSLSDDIATEPMPEGVSGMEVYAEILSQLDIAGSFSTNLANEASSLTLTLSDVLGYALSAVSVSRPTADVMPSKELPIRGPAPSVKVSTSSTDVHTQDVNTDLIVQKAREVKERNDERNDSILSLFSPGQIKY